jgi:predicted Fe-Mo cluster-binding NifX family protein
MIIAIPVVNNQLCMHFGHCDIFAFYEVDENEKSIINKTMIVPPPHEPGILPPWIKSQGGDLVITGGMGQKAQTLFQEAGVDVIVGVTPADPEQIVSSYLHNSLKVGTNVCGHLKIESK